MSDKLLIDRKLLERLQERLDPHIDARDWGMVCDAFRVQLPSQGGEAVAWRVTGRGGITVTAQYPEWAEADCLLTITPLYTHPADQAAEGVVVSRDLLERAADIITNSVVYSPETCDRVAKELRQLLAKSEGVKI